MEALRTLRAVPGVIAPVRLSLILLACGGTRYIQVYPWVSRSDPPVGTILKLYLEPEHVY